METLHGHCHFGISPIITGVNFGYCSKWTAQPLLFIVGNYFFYDTLYIIICSPFFCGRFRIFQSYHKTMLISAERPGITCTLHHWFQIPFILLYYTRSEPTLIITSAIPPVCALALSIHNNLTCSTRANLYRQSEEKKEASACCAQEKQIFNEIRSSNFSGPVGICLSPAYIPTIRICQCVRSWALR